MLAFFHRKRGIPLNSQNLDEATIRGNLSRVMLTRELKLVDSMRLAVDIATVRGDEEMLEKLVEGVNNPRYLARAMDGASEEGFLLMVVNLNRLGASCTRRAIDLATSERIALRGRCTGPVCAHKSVVRHLVSKRKRCDVDKCVVMARTHGRQQIVDILEAYRHLLDQTLACQRSSRYMTYRRRQVFGVRFDASLSHVVYRELEREMWPKGVPTRPLSDLALESSLPIDWYFDEDDIDVELRDDSGLPPLPSLDDQHFYYPYALPDLAAVYGNPHFLQDSAAVLSDPGLQEMRISCDDESSFFGAGYQEQVGCTVSGLYGAIINNHVDIARHIYENQQELADWPKTEGGAEVLRKILHPGYLEMLRFFRQVKGMQLEARDLVKAVAHGGSLEWS